MANPFHEPTLEPSMLAAALRSATDGAAGAVPHPRAIDEILSTGVALASSSPQLTKRWHEALAALAACVLDGPHGEPMLIEGGPYHGCWLESTGSISAEIASRFMPAIVTSTFNLYPRFQNEDGLLAYKVTPEGPAYRQIQMVTPLARSVWNHYRGGSVDRQWLRRLYDSMSRFDAWLARYRDTRGTGGVEAFCTFDTGHDLSPRFWHVPDTCYGEDARRYDPDSPILPFVAPDLTANVACQRSCLARIARELGDPDAATAWDDRAAASLRALHEQCFDEADAFYYDRAAGGEHVRVQSDVLLRVLACEVGDDAFFARSLERYLLNTRKFFARYPLTSIALDDPRYDSHQEYNSWGGTTNTLTLARTPHAFEHHGRHVELSWIMQPAIAALARGRRFAQNLNPWNGDEGYTSDYSPAMLTLLDFVERTSGILPRPDHTVWFTGLTPSLVEGTSRDGVATAYARTIDGARMELHVSAPDANGEGTAVVSIDGREAIRFPRGVRLVTDRSGAPRSLTGMTVREVRGELAWAGRSHRFALRGNEVALVGPDRIDVVPRTTASERVIRPR